jgi:alkanesulfonate monooxygenase SsuD/methylene tetrahydromethanopterin reductase-like flavin-dependent oxidoreductase (luciferase family)
MEFGIFAPFYVREGRPEHEAFDEWVRLAEDADSAGIDCFWLAEFHFRSQTPLSAPLVVGGAIAARTKAMNIGLGVQLLPLANPLRLAEECATLDHLSGGRLVYGIGRSSFIDSYQGYGVDYEQSRPMFFEALDVLRRAWSQEAFSYEGKYYKFQNVDVQPKPYQQPHPPIRIACESRASFAMMGKLGYPILIRHQMEIPELRQLLGEYELERHKAGFGGPNEVTLQANCYLAETKAKAIAEPEYSTMRDRQIARERALRSAGDDEARERLARIQAPAYDEVLPRMLYGTPEEVADRIQEYRDELGITGVSLNMNVGGQIPHENVVNSIRLLMDRVAPRLN